MIDRTSVAMLASLVGRTHKGCWTLVREAFLAQGVRLPDNPYDAQRQFFEVRAPEPWDVIVLCNHTTPQGVLVEDHVGVMLTSTSFVHSLEGAGATIGYTDRAPWKHKGRIASFLRLRE